MGSGLKNETEKKSTKIPTTKSEPSLSKYQRDSILYKKELELKEELEEAKRKLKEKELAKTQKTKELLKEKEVKIENKEGIYCSNYPMI